MIAHLLELHQRRQHDAAPLHALSFFDALDRIAHDSLVQRGLFFGQIAVDLDLVLGRQVADDGQVGLDTPQDKGADQRFESLSRRQVARAFDGTGEALLKILLGSEEARVENELPRGKPRGIRRAAIADRISFCSAWPCLVSARSGESGLRWHVVQLC